MNEKLYFLRTLSLQTHPGSEEQRSFIDKEIQRDKTSLFPMIRGSSFKGALSKAMSDDVDAEKIFGHAKHEGEVGFDDFPIIFLPLAANFHHAVLVTSQMMMKRFNEHLDVYFGQGFPEFDDLQVQDIDVYTAVRSKSTGLYMGRIQVALDDYHGESKKLLHLLSHNKMLNPLGLPIAVAEESLYKETILRSIPYVTRNILDDGGISKELWHEEFLPYGSVGYGVLSVMDTFDPPKSLRLGASKSVGYGKVALIDGSDMIKEATHVV